MNHDPLARIAKRSRTWSFASFDERASIEELACALQSDGAATIEGHSLKSFYDLCWNLGSLYGRGKNDDRKDLLEDTISDDGSRIDHHTDGSLRYSPKIVGMYCVTSAIAGGESLLVDGRELYVALGQRGDGALDYAKATPVMRDSEGNPFTMFTQSRGRVIMRFDPKIQDTALNEAVWEEIATIQKERRLANGEGLFLDNTRMIHARAGYLPPRTMIRIWIDPKEEFSRQIGRGFVPYR